MTTRLPPGPAPIRRIVEIACRAPSIHNTQPWSWQTNDASLELHVDRSRQLSATDPLGRNLVISCGAALHHAQVAASGLGWEVELTRVPAAPASTLLARLQFERGSTPSNADELLRAANDRRTDRRRYTSWPVPDERLQHLAAIAEKWGVRALPMLDLTERFQVEQLVDRALELQAADELVSAEQHAWLDHSPLDGIPSTVLTAGGATAAQANRFGTGLLQDHGEIESGDGLIVLCSGADDPDAWLRAGEALSALWLAAELQGLAVVPISQVIEVAQTRDALQGEVLGGMAQPLVLVRVGWQPTSQDALPRTSRRPVDEVLRHR